MGYWLPSRKYLSWNSKSLLNQAYGKSLPKASVSTKKTWYWKSAVTLDAPTAATHTKAAVDKSTKAIPALLSRIDAYRPPKKDVGLEPLIFGSLKAFFTQGLQHRICASSLSSRAPLRNFIRMSKVKIATNSVVCSK